MATDPPEVVPTPAKAAAGPRAPPLPSPKPTKATDRWPKPCFSKLIDKTTKVAKPIRFDIMKQLNQILANVSLHELLILSPATRKALIEALVDAEVFMTLLAEPFQPEVL